MPISDRPVIVTIRHWLPIKTRCPVNQKADYIYVSLTFKGAYIPELYEVRRTVRDMVSGKMMFMEDIAVMIAKVYSNAAEVTVRLMFNRHVVTVKNYQL